MLHSDLDKASGKAAAIIAIQSALIAKLITRNVLTREDAAELTGFASVSIKTMLGLSDGAREMAESALKGFAGSWLKDVTRN